MPACAALGHIADASSDAAALAVEHGAVGALTAVLTDNNPVHVCAVACTALGSLSMQAETSRPQLAELGTLQSMLSSTIIRGGRPMGPVAVTLARTGIAKSISQCGDYATLVWLLEALPFPDEKDTVDEGQVTSALLKRLGALLSEQGFGNQRLDFVQRGALARAQKAKAYKQSDPRDSLTKLNSVFPQQMVHATDPNYESKLLDKIG